MPTFCRCLSIHCTSCSSDVDPCSWSPIKHWLIQELHRYSIIHTSCNKSRQSKANRSTQCSQLSWIRTQCLQFMAGTLSHQGSSVGWKQIQVYTCTCTRTYSILIGKTILLNKPDKKVKSTIQHEGLSRGK